RAPLARLQAQQPSQALDLRPIPGEQRRSGRGYACPLHAPHLVDTDGASEDECVVLVRRDLDTVSIPDAEPTFRHFGHLVAAPFELELVVDDVALGLHVLAAFSLDRVAVAKWADERLFDRRHRLAVTLDLHLVAHAQLLLLDREQLLTGWTFQDERVADAERLPVDFERLLAVPLD